MAAKGMGGPGGFDMNALLKQAQKMQEEMVAAQEALKDEEVEASAGGGVVKVKMSGDLRVTGIEIDPEAASDPDGVEILSEMVQAAVNEAIRSAQALAASKMPDLPDVGGSGGIPGLPGQ
jgi:DNA-binding YbaB/EbfC family protein